MVLEPSEVSVCLQHPGFDMDLEVRVETATLYRVYLGKADCATRSGRKADDERPACAPARLWSLVRLERVRPRQPLAEQRRTAASRLGTLHSVRIAD